ncbi:MAG: hypothetical protein HKO94_06940 [Flavobacteriaceae bacterium]|nr:hypothetical protein [Flavobacteriaceae bacterium]
MSKIWQELKRRNVIKAAISYVVFSWVLIQVAAILYPSFGWGQEAISNTLIVLIVVFPIWIVFAFVFEWTPKGFKKTEYGEEESIDKSKNRKFNAIIIAGLSLAVLLLIADRIFKFTEVENLDRSIAVLYFDNMSADENNAWISDGMTESISTKLEPIQGLVVTGRTSVKQFKNSSLSIPEIANKLKVSYVLEGSVRVQNNKAVITAQLINKDNEHVWAKEYEVILDDVLDIQSSIARKIVDELQVALVSGDSKKLEYKITDNLEAYKLYQKGRALADDRSREGLEKSIEFYKQALILDPGFSQAYAEIGNSYYLMGKYKLIDNIESTNLAKTYLNKAFAIDTNTVRALTVQAMIFKADGEKERSKKYLERAIELNPNDATAHHHFTTFFNDDPEKFLYHAQIAQRLEPLSIPINGQYLWGIVGVNKFDEAMAHWDNVRDLFPASWSNFGAAILARKADTLFKKSKDRMTYIKVYNEASEKYPNDSDIHFTLGRKYDGILNDNIQFLKHAKRAYKLDSTSRRKANNYLEALIENKQFDKALEFMKSENYSKIVREDILKEYFFYYYYAKRDYTNCKELVNDVPYYYQLFYYAQLGKKNNVFEIFKKNEVDNTTKAFVYAILKKKDSMYYYLDQNDIDFEFVNSRFEFDSYRKEEGYIGLLKKHHLPLTQWNND